MTWGMLQLARFGSNDPKLSLKTSELGSNVGSF
jgi:hypothetical protein